MFILGQYDFELDMKSRNTLSLMAERIDRKSKVLELGPAYGRFTCYLQQEKECIIDIVEIDAEGGANAALYADRAYVGSEQGDVEKYYWNTPDREMYYDYIVCADVLEHLHNPQKVLEICKSLLKPEGIFLISVPNIAHNSILIELWNDCFNYQKTGLLDSSHIHFFTINSLRKMLWDTGLDISMEEAINISVQHTEFANGFNEIPQPVAICMDSRPYGSAYEYVFEACLPGTKKKAQSLAIIENNGLRSGEITCYPKLENEESYREAESINVVYTIPEDKKIIIQIPLDNFESLCSLRLDILEEPCSVQILSLDVKYSDGMYSPARIMETNANRSAENIYTFDHSDPVILVQLMPSGKAEYLKASFVLLDLPKRNIFSCGELISNIYLILQEKEKQQQLNTVLLEEQRQRIIQSHDRANHLEKMVIDKENHICNIEGSLVWRMYRKFRRF